jgi:CO/xanthine dehydrogenase FAD-binding subunit
MELSTVTSTPDYHRPESLEEALALLGRNTPATRPVAGGTHYRRGLRWPAAVVDLAGLNVDGVDRVGAWWRIGASASLDSLASHGELPAELRRAAARQAPRNVRQRATIGGVVATGDSGTLLVCLLALDARLMIEPGGRIVPLQVYLQSPDKRGSLITACLIPVARACAFAEISRSPADLPVLVVAVAAETNWGSWRGVIAAAGGADQRSVILPGASQVLHGAPDADLATLAAATPENSWQSDTRGSAAYRAAMTPVLLQRAAAALRSTENPERSSGDSSAQSKGAQDAG